jgi:succinate dehydrogenase hydrophobic anchor subunit
MSEHLASASARQANWFSLQRALGYGPLLMYSVYHLWAQWPALYGRDAWLDRAHRHGVGRVLGTLVIASFFVHAAIGLYRALRAPDTHVPRGRRLFQLATGLTLLAFTIFHLTHVWPRPDGGAATLERSHERLWELLGQPFVLAIYVLGCGALAGHAAHALVLWLEPHLPARVHTPARLVLGLSGFVLFTLYLQLIGQYAAGEPMLPQLTAVDDALEGDVLHAP